MKDEARSACQPRPGALDWRSMGDENVPDGTGIDRGLRRLMASVGVIMMVTPSSELMVQLWYHERPQILLLSGLFLVGLLALSHALSRRRVPLLHLTPPDLRLHSAHTSGESIWSPDPRD